MATLNTKRALIDKSNSRIVIITAVAAFVIVFSLVASKSLLAQDLYNGKVISEKKKALQQLQVNINETEKLVSAYKAFVGTPQNLLGGDPSGTGPKDGSNAKLVLDALPSQYDFPALATSLEKMIKDENLEILGITGIDDELAQQANRASATPQSVPMPFQINVKGSLPQVQSLIVKLEHSIRPFEIQKIDFVAGGDSNGLTVNITAQTYYQPGKTLSITKAKVQP